ncbi:MAG: hypothetical protein M9921_00640 [Fimbriimonadaceae bacterium]|nr:hypothetical protein [Chthonomonadaceae bacterium]MCO5295341.1 hypothetical protein [Fimbriimonadaceae bacterium]
MIQKLTTEFIPFAGDTHELQNGRSAARNWFVAMARTVNPRISDGQTAQGFYTASPDGKGLGFNNNRSVERVLGLLDLGLAKSSPASGPIEPAPGDRGGAREDVFVARTFTRIRPLPPGSAESNKNVARDHLWIYPADVEAILAGKGDRFPAPAAFARRLARFHLVDNVRGEPDMWSASEVRKAELFVVRDPRGFKLEGDFEMETANGSRGLDASFEGWIELDGGTIKRFLGLAKGKAWGAGRYTPNPPEGVFPIVVAMVEANDAASRRVPPQGLLWGPEYRGSGAFAGR